MKTTFVFDSNSTDPAIADIKKSEQEYRQEHPNASPDHFVYKGEGWRATSKGYSYTVSAFVHELPLLLEGIPVLAVEFVDHVEDPFSSFNPKCGIYRRGKTNAVVDSYLDKTAGPDVCVVYTITVTGKTLRSVNKMYDDIRQHQISPSGDWGKITVTE